MEGYQKQQWRKWKCEAYCELCTRGGGRLRFLFWGAGLSLLPSGAWALRFFPCFVPSQSLGPVDFGAIIELVDFGITAEIAPVGFSGWLVLVSADCCIVEGSTWTGDGFFDLRVAGSSGEKSGTSYDEGLPGPSISMRSDCDEGPVRRDFKFGGSSSSTIVEPGAYCRNFHRHVIWRAPYKSRSRFSHPSVVLPRHWRMWVSTFAIPIIIHYSCTLVSPYCV